MKTRTLVAAILAILLILSVGCAATTSKDAAPSTGASDAALAPVPLVLTDSGWAMDERGYVTWGFILENPNADAGAENLTVRITMKDAGGAVVGTADVAVKRIMPGATVALGGEDADPHGKVPATVDFEVPDPGAGWRRAERMEPVGFRPLTVTGQSASKQGATTSFTGQLKNPNNAALKEVCLTLLLRDKAGKLFYGGYNIVQDVKAGASQSVRMDLLGVTDYATFEMSAAPW
jgi:hypothetical protein